VFRFNNQLILKVTKDCNLRCEYCYLRHKGKFKNQFLKFEVVKFAMDRMFKEMLVQNENSKTIIFHGGEPTLLGKTETIKILDYITVKARQYNFNIRFGMQSNLTLIDEEWASILSKYDISLGCSYDGEGEANEKRTKTYKQEAFENVFDILKAYNVDFGFLFVVGSNNINTVKDDVPVLLEKYDLHGVKVNYVEDVTGYGGEVGGKEFFENTWQIELENFIQGKVKNLEQNTSNILRRFFSDYLTTYTKISKSNCGESICGAGVNIVEMEPDGEFYYCGRF